MRALYTAATGMKAQQLRIDSVANNLANVNTTAFKKSDAQFEDMFYEKVQTGSGATAQGTTAADTVEVGHGVRAGQVRRDFSNGGLQQTGRPTDMAIVGEGFFGVTDAEGNELFTRNGNFTADANGNLVLPNGMALADGITIPAEFDSLSIREDGVVLATIAGEPTQVGQIQLRTFTNPSGLDALGAGLYRATEASGVAQTVIPDTGNAGSIQERSLELSNVDVAEELISMIQAQRAYELTGKVIQASDEMMQATNQLK